MSILPWFKPSQTNEEDLQQLRNAQSLDGISSCIMMADANRTIVYANDSVKKLLKEAESDIQAVLPQFSADNLIGQSIDQFHKNPNHQRNILGNLRQQMSSSIVVGKQNFQLHLTPLFDLDGNNIGTTVEWIDQSELLLKSGMLDALDRSQAVIEFDVEGIIQTANDNFLNTMDYRLSDIQGQHHSMFVEPEHSRSTEYRQFWADLKNGEIKSGEFFRIGRNGKEVWIHATYNPIFDSAGNVTKVVKFASDITEQKRKSAYFEGQISAINKSQAVIEFEPDGTIVDANDNFLNTVGYSLDEIKGKHHSMFVETEFKNSEEYRNFWHQLAKGHHSSGEYKRIGKGGKDIWIQATYNPILDQNGRTFRVVKYASDITDRTTAVNTIKQTMTQLATGDLTCKIQQEFKGDFKVVGESINQFIDDMCGTIASINEAVETINSASSEIASGNADLSSRTEQQASSLEETASSMEEITGTVRLNAENAEQANSLASQASKIAIEGGDMIQSVVSTMSSINESAQKISDIIGVIDGIAFQTNILALNAAVEAARAGEQGRGFAVVASEVRTLAQRSAEAAKDIKELISDSVAKVSSGNTLVNQSGETMQEVVTSIKRVNDIMSEIAAASAEQSAGIDEVGKAVSQMDEMTQQNAALVEQAAAAAESLQQQSGQLSERVATFKLDESMLSRRTTDRIEHRSSTVTALPNARAMNGSKPIVRASDPHSDEWESF